MKKDFELLESESLRDWYFIEHPDQIPEGTGVEWRALILEVSAGNRGKSIDFSPRLALEIQQNGDVLICNPKQISGDETGVTIPAADVAAWVIHALSGLK